ncbi:MAG: hypothetical protein WCS94_05620 [Verrucomicrobiota bacterium]
MSNLRKSGYDLPVSSLDVFPTTLNLAGRAMPTNHPPDGVNWFPFLTGTNTKAPRSALFWRAGGDNSSPSAHLMPNSSVNRSRPRPALIWRLTGLENHPLPLNY